MSGFGGPLGVVRLHSGELQLLVGALGVALRQTGSQPGTWSPASAFPLAVAGNALPSGIGACQNEDGAPQVWGIAGGTLNTRVEPVGSSAWTPATVLTPQPSGPPGYPINAIAAGMSGSSDIRLFAAVPDLAQHIGRLITCRQKVPNHKPFTAWSVMAGAPSLDEYDPVLALCQLPAKRLQAWVGSSTGEELFTSWEESTQPDSPWTEWQAVDAPKKGIVQLACGMRPDGHVQLWGIETGMSLVTAVQSASPPAAGVLNWVAHALPAGVSTVSAVAVGEIGGSRLQLFIAVDLSPLVGVYTCWSQGAGYTPWVQITV